MAPKVVSATPNQGKARKPECLRLKGFDFKLPKPDMICVAKGLMKHLDMISSVKEFHCSAIAGSCVVEFNSPLDARKTLDLSKDADTKWHDSETDTTSELFFSYDESSEVRAFGTALHFLFDSVEKHILPHAPKGSGIQTDKVRGLIQLRFGRIGHARFFPLLQIGTSDGGLSFYFIEKRGRWMGFKVPPFVTPEMLTCVKNEMLALDLFTAQSE